jgi:putative addiction module component (TIGR02574 family)
MTQAAEQLKSQLATLSSEDRAALARFLIDSLDEADSAAVDRAWEAELSRRAAEICAGTAQGEPADKVLTELREKYS